ncbi:T9SS type A sorting domain-containing protein [Patescibacteria group bacterium]|nr:T9SS type A sorting domain-containing protein [Patescibacteria group bacterium]
MFCLQSNTSKADTIYIQMPAVIQDYCQSAGLDTFVFYKPLGFGSTMWLVSGSYVWSGDSMVYVPPTVGVFNIAAIWNGNSVSFNLKLYDALPPHANFSATSGGGYIINDTVWMCSDSILIDPTVNSNDASYRSWTGPGGFNSTGLSVDITVPGTYYFERGNPCGITIDTFEVVLLPFVLPSFGPDTTFCNTAVSLTLDPGTGWSYSWNTGASMQSIVVDTAGTYVVNLSNFCMAGDVSIFVDYQSFPLPDLTYLESMSGMCADSVLTLDPNPGFIYDAYLWSNGFANATIDISGLTTGSGFYQVTITQGGACTATAQGLFNFFGEPMEPEICIVTVDSTLSKNKIVWTSDYEPPFGDPSNARIATYNIYKWAGGSVWTFLGNTPVNQEHTFIDMTSNPPAVSARYKITAVDSCGVESTKSFYHQTILLSVMAGGNPGEVPLIWTPYLDESGLFVVDQYDIYRGQQPYNLQYLTSTPFTSYNDIGVTGQKYYQIVVTKVGGCNPSVAGTKGLIMGSNSNITHNIITGVVDNPLDAILSIYPNPSSDGIFHIEGETSRVDVMDNLGRVLISSSDTSIIDLSTYVSGVYYARLLTKQGSTIKKLMIK